MKNKLFSLLLLWSCVMFTAFTFTSTSSACPDGIDKGNGMVSGEKGNSKVSGEKGNGLASGEKGNGFNSGEKGNGIA